MECPKCGRHFTCRGELEKTCWRAKEHESKMCNCHDCDPYRTNRGQCKEVYDRMY